MNLQLVFFSSLNPWEKKKKKKEGEKRRERRKKSDKKKEKGEEGRTAGLWLTWNRYPFHLRPKNKQAFQYVRMAVDIIHDLELDQDPGPENASNPDSISERRLLEVRAYLATYYLVCRYVTLRATI
jgi:hypothetical protein